MNNATLILGTELFFLSNCEDQNTIDDMKKHLVVLEIADNKDGTIFAIGDLENDGHIKPLCFDKEDEVSIDKASKQIELEYGKGVITKPLSDEHMTGDGLYYTKHASECSGSINTFAMNIYDIAKTRPEYKEAFEDDENPFQYFVKRIIKHAVDSDMSSVAEEVLDSIYTLTKTIDAVNMAMTRDIDEDEIKKFIEE